MEHPTAPPGSHVDALDELEGRARDLLLAENPDWKALLVAIDLAEKEGPLYSKPPPIDPSEGRRSSAELRRLIQTLQGRLPEPPPRRTRAGFALEGAFEGEARVIPAFAAAIGGSGLRDGFPDLWAIDAVLWQRLEAADARELARLWLESPGRRLVEDLGIIARLPTSGPAGASELSPQRIDSAAGLHLLETPRGHQELHRALPGESLDTWRPEPVDEDKQVLRALQLLEEGSPLGLRGAALSWLLDRAADNPFYAVDDIRRDLRDDLPIRLSTALISWLGDNTAATVPRQLETLALQHAARIVSVDSPVDAARRGWAVARWLQGCLRRSPFYGTDEEVLAAHLQARLPTVQPPIPANADALFPGRFSLDDGGLDVAGTAFLAGVLAHYRREHDRTLLPTPVPLIHALQAIASRSVSMAEEAADAALAAGRNALGWPEGYPLALPLAARHLMTDLRIGWIAQVGEAAQIDSIERFAKDPGQHGWIAFAIQREGQHLGDDARARGVAVFRALSATGPTDARVVGTFGTGLLAGLTDEEADRILVLAIQTDPLWRPFVIDALAGASERLGRAGIWLRALDRLVALMEDMRVEDKTRLNAALFAMRRASASNLPGREALLGRLAAIAASPPFQDHLGLRREIRRLGLLAPAPHRST
jgi:hypothetical protein